jgi:hypothetical protein
MLRHGERRQQTLRVARAHRFPAIKDHPAVTNARDPAGMFSASLAEGGYQKILKKTAMSEDNCAFFRKAREASVYILHPHDMRAPMRWVVLCEACVWTIST